MIQSKPFSEFKVGDMFRFGSQYEKISYNQIQNKTTDEIETVDDEYECHISFTDLLKVVEFSEIKIGEIFWMYGWHDDTCEWEKRSDNHAECGESFLTFHSSEKVVVRA